MGRSISSFNRGEARLKYRPKVLILCEDSKSGKRYLEDAAFHFRANAQVEIAHCGVTHPSGIVERAIASQKNFDKVFCALDRDTHLCFDRAIDLAKPHPKIKIIASFPCFEFWLLLHFGYNRKPFTAVGKHSPGDLVAKSLREKPNMDKYEKGKGTSYFALLLGEPFERARSLAPRILEDVVKSGEPNPSTEIHLLMDEFETLSKPQPI
ncbi:RloB domain-containing protein [Pseudomonas sp. ADAK2]|uniref:RloB family protein n=1 Tax=unclassified Pseudomonas TaxID=196821 RepID=UPI001462CAA1|nr:MULTISPECIES: RloB family protein [unclassified Pseudomonas]QJI42159.1 RloB domain-containing protein [Pseudomonas sp. ADAK7]QJI48462.1 RloB domain-containing protein [Pseudomonas sp. ADAK2]